MEAFDQIGFIVSDAVALHGKFRSEKTAVVCGRKRFSWGMFSERINRVANALIDRGLKKGRDRVRGNQYLCLGHRGDHG